MNNPTKSVPIMVKNLKKGYRIIESEMGCVALMEALEDAREINDQENKRVGHECLVRIIDNTITEPKINDTITLFENSEYMYVLRLRLVGRVDE